MQNFIECKNCNSKNNFYSMNCDNCGAILRSRVVNIDLWKTIWQLIESPKKAFENIIFAEHKNFISFLIILIGIKLFANSNFILNLTFPKVTSEFGIPLQLFLSVVLAAVLIGIIAFILKLLLNPLEVKTRFKDNLALIIYSHTPLILALVILLPLEYGIFGGHWIYYNPSPFIIKAGSAYLLSALELLFIIWQLVMLTLGLYVQTKGILFSILSAIIIEVVLLGVIGLFPPFIAGLI